MGGIRRIPRGTGTGRGEKHATAVHGIGSLNDRAREAFFREIRKDEPDWSRAVLAIVDYSSTKGDPGNVGEMAARLEQVIEAKIGGRESPEKGRPKTLHGDDPKDTIFGNERRLNPEFRDLRKQVMREYNVGIAAAETVMEKMGRQDEGFAVPKYLDEVDPKKDAVYQFTSDDAGEPAILIAGSLMRTWARNRRGADKTKVLQLREGESWGGYYRLTKSEIAETNASDITRS